jgi:hypothetical protein
MTEPSLTANVNPIVVDNTASPPELDGTALINYRKAPLEELWERKPGSGWTKRQGTDDNDERGSPVSDRSRNRLPIGEIHGVRHILDRSDDFECGGNLPENIKHEI